jgi:hypothetical protein
MNRCKIPITVQFGRHKRVEPCGAQVRHRLNGPGEVCHKPTRSGWFIRSRYQGVPHWFVRGGQVSICGLLKFSRWASDPEPFKKVPRHVGQAIGCFFCLKKKGKARRRVQKRKARGKRERRAA